MSDKLTPQQRHKNMAAIRSKDTKPSKREETLDSIAFTLNHIWLQDHRAKSVASNHSEEESGAVPMAAEE